MLGRRVLLFPFFHSIGASIGGSKVSNPPPLISSPPLPHSLRLRRTTISNKMLVFLLFPGCQKSHPLYFPFRFLCFFLSACLSLFDLTRQVFVVFSCTPPRKKNVDKEAVTGGHRVQVRLLSRSIGPNPLINFQSGLLGYVQAATKGTIPVRLISAFVSSCLNGVHRFRKCHNTFKLATCVKKKSHFTEPHNQRWIHSHQSGLIFLVVQGACLYVEEEYK